MVDHRCTGEEPKQTQGNNEAAWWGPFDALKGKRNYLLDYSTVAVAVRDGWSSSVMWWPSTVTKD